MRIGGLQKLTLIDYPGKIAATVFTQGCNLRCGYCHNSELVLPKHFCSLISEEEVLRFLYKRRPHLEGVVITGGEPTIQKNLIPFMKKIKQLGYLIKLDTNGTFPVGLEKVIHAGFVDYIAMDIKTSLEKYSRMTGVPCSGEDIKRSIHLIRHSGADFEFRTTVVKSFCTEEDLEKIKSLIGASDRYKIQRFQESDKMIDAELLKESRYSNEEMAFFEKKFTKLK